MRILITGSSGFLGRSIAKKLAASGHRVFTLKSSFFCTTELDDNAHQEGGNLKVTCSDFHTYIDDLRLDVVVHTAVTYGANGESPLEILNSNVGFGLRLLQTLHCIGRPIVFVNTDSALARDISFYSLSKTHFVEWARLLTSASNSGIQFINAKLQLIYGPGDKPEKFVPRVLHALRNNDSSIDLTCCEQLRDFIYIEDAVNALETIIDNVEKLEKFCEIDIGSGVACRLRDFVILAGKLLKSSTKLNFGGLPYRRHEQFNLRADIAKVSSLGWTPRFDLTTGILLTIRGDFDN